MSWRPSKRNGDWPDHLPRRLCRTMATCCGEDNSCTTFGERNSTSDRPSSVVQWQLLYKIQALVGGPPHSAPLCANWFPCISCLPLSVKLGKQSDSRTRTTTTTTHHPHRPLSIYSWVSSNEQVNATICTLAPPICRESWRPRVKLPRVA